MKRKVVVLQIHSYKRVRIETTKLALFKTFTMSFWVCYTDRAHYEKERLSLDRMVKNYGSRYGLMECFTEAHGT